MCRRLYTGIGLKEKKKKRAAFYEKLAAQGCRVCVILLCKSRGSRNPDTLYDGISELVKLEKNKERKTAWDDQHWSEKPLTETTKRD